MRKIILAMLVFVASVLGTQKTITGGLYSAASIAGTDTILVDGTVGNDTIDWSGSFMAMRRPATNTALMAISGTPALTIAYFWHDSGTTGTKAYPTSITIDSVGAVVKISAGTGTVTGTSTDWIWNKPSGTMNDYKGISWKSLTMANSANLTISGGSNHAYNSTSKPLVMGDDCKLTVNSTTRFYYNAASGNLITLGARDTFAGTGAIHFCYRYNSAIDTVPALYSTGSGAITINEGVAGARTGINLSWAGHTVLTGGLNLFLSYGTSSAVYKLSGYNITSAESRGNGSPVTLCVSAQSP